MTDKSDFEKLSKYLLRESLDHSFDSGIYPLLAIQLMGENCDNRGELPESDSEKEALNIAQSLSRKEEAAFLIYFGYVCMRELEGN